jgi:acetolactate synthase-1/2/3 large subunit
VTEEVVTEATAARGDSLFGPNADAFFASCASGLRTSPSGAAALLLGGDATLADNGALHIASAIAAATGAALLCENGFARVDRGGDGLPALTRLPYFPREAAKALSAFSCLVLVDCKLPTPMFGYASGPRDVVSLSEDAIWEIDAQDAVAALRKLASALDIPLAALTPQMATKAVASRELSQELRAARDHALTPPLLCAVVAALQPANAIVVDESLTSGTDYWMRSANAPAFSHLTLTGGAIGQGPPMAVGAAVACPTRRVINFQADGSGLYSAQALWTQAREQLDVVTIICANNKYNILRIELALQRVNCTASAGVGRSLTDLGQPSVDWVSLAKGFGVANATRATTVGELADQLAAALARKGPSLIEACLP